MSYRLVKLGIGLYIGKTRNWTILKASKKNLSINKEQFIIKYITDCLFNILFNLRKKADNTQFIIPIFTGDVRLHFVQGQLIILVNYCFNHIRLKDYEKLYFFSKLFYSLMHFKNHIKMNFIIIFKNIFQYINKWFMLENIMRINDFEPTETYSRLLNILFHQYEMHVYSKNRFFHRALYCILAGFITGDAVLLSNLFSNEVALLRKHHQKYFSFISLILLFCYERCNNINGDYKDKLILGILVAFKGRLTLRTRQLPRKAKLRFQCGTLKTNESNLFLFYNSASAITRFGVVGIKVWVLKKNTTKDYLLFNNNVMGIEKEFTIITWLINAKSIFLDFLKNYFIASRNNLLLTDYKISFFKSFFIFFKKNWAYQKRLFSLINRIFSKKKIITKNFYKFIKYLNFLFIIKMRELRVLYLNSLSNFIKNNVLYETKKNEFFEEPFKESFLPDQSFSYVKDLTDYDTTITYSLLYKKKTIIELTALDSYYHI